MTSHTRCADGYELAFETLEGLHRRFWGIAVIGSNWALLGPFCVVQRATGNFGGSVRRRGSGTECSYLSSEIDRRWVGRPAGSPAKCQRSSAERSQLSSYEAAEQLVVGEIW